VRCQLLGLRELVEGALLNCWLVSTYPLDDLRPRRHALQNMLLGRHLSTGIAIRVHACVQTRSTRKSPYSAWREAPGDPSGSTRRLEQVRSTLTKYVPIALRAASWLQSSGPLGRFRAGLQRSPVPSQAPGTSRRMAATATGRRWIVRAYTVYGRIARSPASKAQHP
jgi:hypothetical protein